MVESLDMDVSGDGIVVEIANRITGGVLKKVLC